MNLSKRGGLMGWIEALYRTYENCSEVAGEKKDELMLIPKGHLTVKAQVEVQLDTEGHFIRAQVVGEPDAVTLIPVTEDSAARANGITPHPLNDKLCYIAGDYDILVQTKKAMKPYYDAYIKQLKGWAESPFADEKVRAIYTYLNEGHLIEDLIQEKILELDPKTGKLSDAKVAKINQADVFVRFSVWKDHPDPWTYTDKTWEDRNLQKAFIQYVESQNHEKGLCYVSGEETALIQKHPSKIRNAGDKSKLISSNDNNTNSLTFRGRFLDAKECVSVGFKASEEAHNALRWLIEKQGRRNGSECIVAWAIGNKEEKKNIDLPQPTDSSFDIFGAVDIEEKKTIDTADRFAMEFNSAMAGYRSDPKIQIPVVVMAVDTADGSSQGRLAVTYYQELEKSQFLKNIQDWHQNGAWGLRLWDNEKKEYFDFWGVPSPREIALTAFGVEREVQNMKKLDANEKLIKGTVQRILPCIVARKSFPRDLMLSAVRNVSRPQAMSMGNWSRVLKNTCSIISIYYYTHNKEVKKLGLDKNETDRSYLFGRLLAVANHVEYVTFGDDEKKRQTNAKRYWSVYAKRPASTWNMLRDKLNPYWAKIEANKRAYYETVIDEITDKLSADTFTNKPLTELYVLGYDQQTSDFWKKKNENEEEKNKEGE